MARPRKQIDKKQFETLCAMFCTELEIAHVFDVDFKTIMRFCQREYRMGFREAREKFRTQGKLTIRREQMKAVQRGYWPAIERMGEIYLGQNLKQSIEISGSENGSPIQIENKTDYSKLSVEELRSLQSIAEKIKNKKSGSET